ncbi:MAG: TadE/TadG family type IV pilus assembly protein [Sphingomonas sp.]
MTRALTLLRATGRRLGRDTSGVALLEFALTAPVLLLMSLAGAELTNYITTRMRVSQIALHLADNAARIGSGSQLQAKTISEADINDLLLGADMQSGELGLLTNGRVIISALEPMANPNPTGKFKITWQRCKGSKTTHASAYGTYNQPTGTAMTGMGPSGRQATAPLGGQTMFVEVYYVYRPLVKTSLSPTTEMTEVASMMVRDRRDLSQIYNNPAVTKSLC